MNKGDIIEVNIEKGIFGGEGLAFVEGKALFVPEAVAGEKVKVEIISTKKDYARGLIKEIIEPSPDRVKPQCEVFELCGGCDYMMIEYKAQLELKKNIVKEIMAKIGKNSECKINDVVSMKEPYLYRNKVIQPLGKKGNKCISGFYKKRSHEIIDNDFCLIQTDLSNKILKKIKEIINNSSISIYDELAHKGYLRNIMVRVNSENEAMLVLVVNGERTKEIEKIIMEIAKAYSNVKSIYLSINKKRTNVVLGEKNILIYGEEGIYEDVEGVRFLITPLSFFQINNIQMKELYKKAVDYISDEMSPIIVDAYSGTGTIASILAKKAKKVYAIEIIDEAVKSGRKSIKLNKIDNVEFLTGTVEEKLIDLINNGTHIDAIVFDPPRKGLESEIINAVSEANIDKIVYVSCNPSTFARDAYLFAQKGYVIGEITPVDMFPHTHHIELVSKILRRNR